ncbi:putative glycosyltransferase [Gemmatimonas aurantiaca T-27]|uniref:3-deoxy-D-manno-octulosonic acid transferase n=1 Tax=Gemmatimonas aurantiaca (strain DSM 14586 / JCM 11422 / NBRC 100505 / T-27) TaxID=379066 RepID=C1A6A7_GEMAT|nr:glycosyltransferase N-terminal domain-containing protein [Gemmatimonas aurantiaca]BAH37767.1 putative glycosyltransferase [Gemmatimonas aurantiaca T-27]
MHPLLRPLYAGAGALATLIASASTADSAAPQANKLLRTFRARRGVLARWERQAKQHRDPSRPLVWMHAPSVGEGLQARPVAHALREQHPGVQLAYSWFSPSAASFATSIGADFADYLAFDTASAADRMLTALTPSVLVFSKLDIWPVLVERAAARGVPVVLLSGTVAPGSGRRGTLARALTQDAYRALSAVGAIDQANGERLIELGVRTDTLHITGDTRFDQVWQRAQRVDRASPLLTALHSDRPTMVAGSTWPADEAVLLPMWEAVRRAHPAARLIIAPHEPTTSHLTPILTWTRNAALQCATLREVEEGTVDVSTADVIVVDRVGVLGDLYALADMTFVGGGFHSAGLHSVIEPAAFGAPVLFGPAHSMSREAGLLLAAEGAISGDRALLERTLQAWLTTPAVRITAGGRARAVVQDSLGATAQSLQLVVDQLS